MNPMGKILRLGVAAVLLGGFLFCGWKVLGILTEYRRGEKSYEALTEEYVQLLPTEPTVPSAPASQDKGPAPDAALAEPPETAPITVDFDALHAVNPDVVGWLYCPDTPINYPVMQAEDNDYYLYRLLEGGSNANGSIFLDCSCKSDFSDWNSILYGHNMNNGAMFGTLQDYYRQEYFDAHPVMYLLTPEKDYRIDLIAGYTTSDASEDTYAIPQDRAGRDQLIANATRYPTFQADFTLKDDDRLITLSTCAYEFENARYVLLGLLRELARPE